MDEKFTKRYESFKNSLSSLSEARERDMTDSFVLSGTSAKFSITFDLAWKVMKDILVKQLGILDFAIGSPRDTLQQAFTNRLIDDDKWMQMLRIRNQLAHDYDGSLATAEFSIIVNEYIPLFERFRVCAEQYYI